MYDGIATHLVVGFCDQVMRPKHRENEAFARNGCSTGSGPQTSSYNPSPIYFVPNLHVPGAAPRHSMDHKQLIGTGPTCVLIYQVIETR